MLKLQTGKDGKLDITFAEDSGLGKGKIRRAALNTSSAGRRKSKELHQSQVLPKKPAQQQKVSKWSDYKHQNYRENGQKDKGETVQVKRPARQKENRQTKQAGRMGKNKTEGTGADTKEPKNAASTDVGIITQAHLDTLLQALKGGDQTLLSSIAALKSGQEQGASNTNENVRGGSLGEVNSLSDVQGHNGGYDASVYDKWSRAPKGTTEITQISSSGPIQARESHTKTLPMEQPIAMASTFKIGAPGLVTYDYAHQTRERQRKWREELDEQVREKKRLLANEKDLSVRDSFQALKTYSSQSVAVPEGIVGTKVEPRPQLHTQPAAMASSFAIGAPGVVAYDLEEERRARQRQYLQEIRDQIKEQQPRQSLQQQESSRSLSSEVVQSVFTSPSKEPEGSYFGDNRADYNRQSFGRRNFNPKDNNVEREKLDREREKHLQHQRAIQEQVEEKRRIKMEERERRIQEELHEERRLAMEREELNRQHEEEKRKQREKEEAERQRLETLQERVREAYESAQRDKMEAKLRKLKASGHDVSKLEEKHSYHGNLSDNNTSRETPRDTGISRLDLQHLGSVQDLSLPSTRSTKEQRPVVNWGSSPDEEQRAAQSKENKRPSRQSVAGKTSNRGSKTSMNEADELNQPEAPGKADSKKTGGAKGKVKDGGKRVTDHTQREEISSDRQSKVKSKDEVKRVSGGVSTIQDKETKAKKTASRPKKADVKKDQVKSPNAMENGTIKSEPVVPYVRSGTVALKQEHLLNSEEDEQPVESGTEDHDGSSYYEIHRTPTVELSREDSRSRELFTPRQQQILEQLQALRTGLMKKQKEHARGDSA